jgi:hypothetical protein
MSDVVPILLGATSTAAIELLSGLALERIRDRRSLTLTARSVYLELLEYGDLELNGEATDSARLYDAWCRSRGILIDLGREEWAAIDEAVRAAVFPGSVERRPESANGRLERALWLLEPRTGLPPESRVFV